MSKSEIKKTIIFCGNSDDPDRCIDVDKIKIPYERMLITKQFDETRTIGVAKISRENNCIMAEIDCADKSLLGSSYTHFSCSFEIESSNDKPITLRGVAAIDRGDRPYIKKD